MKIESSVVANPVTWTVITLDWHAENKMKGEADALSWFYGFNESKLEHVKGPPCGRKRWWFSEESMQSWSRRVSLNLEGKMWYFFPSQQMVDSYFIDQH